MTTTTARSRATLLAVLAYAAVVWTAGPALAHVELDVTTPGSGETLAEPPGGVSLEFSGPLSPGAGHAIGVFDPGGNRVDGGATAEETDRVITTSVSASAPGIYSVRWLVIAGDGDTQEGEYSFSVEGAAPALDEAPGAAPTTGEQAPIEPPPAPTEAASTEDEEEEETAPAEEPSEEAPPTEAPEEEPAEAPVEEPSEELVVTDPPIVEEEPSEEPSAALTPSAAPSEASPEPTPSAPADDLAVDSGGGLGVGAVAVGAAVLAAGVGVLVARRRDGDDDDDDGAPGPGPRRRRR